MTWARVLTASADNAALIVRTESLEKPLNCLYNKSVQYEWDEAKRQDNLAKHRGVDFSDMDAFEWETAVISSSPRHGEARYVALGYIGDRLHCVVYTVRGDKCRIISLRKANSKEERQYAQA